MNPPTLFDAPGPGNDAVPDARPAPVLYLGRCSAKGCRARARIALPRLLRRTVRGRTLSGVPYEHEIVTPAVLLDDPGMGRRLVTFEELAHRRWLPSCVEHRRPLRFAKLEGTYNGEKPCNARCMGASGPACECACAGANHGGRWG